jgi:catechol 2,3-dioxygenase-like lactoylglutathione lyase family enzyme
MRILELTLAGTDLAALRRFYASVLGLRVLATLTRGGLAVQAGQTRLTFVPAPAGASLPGSAPRYHFAFDVPAERFEAAVTWLRQRGGLIASPTGENRFHSQGWNADMVYFADPVGNVLELIARHAAPEDETRPKIAPETLFSVREILAVSEIGLPAPSVTDAVGGLLERMPGAAIYSGAGSDEFTAVGDERGLLIVVRRGRIWFPETGIQAEFLPVNALVQLETGRRYRLSAPPYPYHIIPEQ